ncbi:MAG: T9SS type A sorting domain-containing protein [Saprospiraceae bacterium]
MKALPFILFFTFSSFSLFSQIPNASFEAWEMIDNYEKPVDWDTNQDTSLARILQDSVFKMDGEYSMHFVSHAPSAWQDCTSRLSTSIVLNDGLGENQSLFFYLKLLSINANNDAYFQIRMEGYKNGQNLGYVDSTFWEEVEEFELIEIPMDFAGAELINFEFLGGAVNGPTDGCHVRSGAWLDGLEIKNSSSTSLTKIEKLAIKIFPNPSFGKIEIQGDWEKYQSYQVYDLLGKELENGNLQSSELILKSKGILILVLKSNSGNQSIFKIINQ